MTTKTKETSRLVVFEREFPNKSIYGVFVFDGDEIGIAYKTEKGWIPFGKRKPLNREVAAKAMIEGDIRGLKRRIVSIEQKIKEKNDQLHDLGVYVGSRGQAMTTTEAIDEIMDNFDFGKVVGAMDALDWKWTIEGRGTDVPLEADLRSAARKLLQGVSGMNAGSTLGSGGLVAENLGAGHLSLVFEVEEWNTAP